ncbi:unnamed protein product [Psylliodes chrysocephalus]|uniref:Uncharacterized protein n=1 Tax=Psylliodes chrysocephalus TaxID=3402493 RepID=A0A9P0D787_9CUCU|nr:unnamed protein product [Psylliodes chrysocephala]
MNSEDFIDSKELAKKYLNTKNLGISKISHFRISHKNPGIEKVASVLAKESNNMETWDKLDVLKKNANLEDLPDVDELLKNQFKCKISQEKKKDIEGMIEYLEKEEDKAFYRAIVHGPQQPKVEEQAEDDNQEEAEVYFL